MTDATTADDFPLGLLVDEALREAQQGLQNSDEEELNKLAETIDPDDGHTRVMEDLSCARQCAEQRFLVQ